MSIRLTRSSIATGGGQSSPTEVWTCCSQAFESSAYPGSRRHSAQGRSGTYASWRSWAAAYAITSGPYGRASSTQRARCWSTVQSTAPA
jgi:hypothetical protein